MSRPPFYCLQCIDIFQILFKLFSFDQPFCSYPNNKPTVRVAGYLSQLICPNSKVGSRLFNRQIGLSQIGTACFSISSTPFCKSQKKSNGRQLARPLRETYSPSYWHFPQPATEWLPLGSRPKRRIMINEYGSWPTNRHSSSAHGIRLPHLSFPPAGSWPGLPARLSIHETYPLLNMRRSTPVCQGASGCLPGRTFRLHLIPRFSSPVLPQKSSPTPLEGIGPL